MMANEGFSPHQERVLWMGALRYYIGRSTSAVHDFCDMLIAAWPTLSADVKALVQRDLEEAFVRDNAEWDHVAARTPFGEQPMRPLNMPLGQEYDWRAWMRVRALWRPVPVQLLASAAGA